VLEFAVWITRPFRSKNGSEASVTSAIGTSIRRFQSCRPSQFSRREVIAQQGSYTYVALDVHGFALAITPFGMASASAAALPPAAAVSGGRYDDHHKPADAPSTPKAHCAVCAALPAINTSMAISELRLFLLRVVQAEQWLVEQEPDIDTPSPKLG
jgi:hypothetical protein